MNTKLNIKYRYSIFLLIAIFIQIIIESILPNLDRLDDIFLFATRVIVAYFLAMWVADLISRCFLKKEEIPKRVRLDIKYFALIFLGSTILYLIVMIIIYVLLFTGVATLRLGL